MLLKVAEFYEEEVDNAVDALSSLLEPLIMIIIGIVVGSMVIGMYLPIFKLAAEIYSSRLSFFDRAAPFGGRGASPTRRSAPRKIGCGLLRTCSRASSLPRDMNVIP
jgi:hypothetical protein